ncbi:hypothetical protein E4U15_007191 [Claviceps sp. LM218 group G6]|nr:hypothetical protein E4U15_007191 [Claviceps sp. LM218 group G6]
MRFSDLAVAAFAGIALAKRGCRHDHEHPGMGWYWTVEFDDLYSIAKDFGDDADAIARRNGIKDTDADTERDSYRYNHRSSMLKMCDDSWEAFFENEPPIPSHLTKVAMKKASPLADGERNDAELLLSHARLYVLADCYGIKPLMGLSLSTLYSVLSEFMEWDDVADMLIKLLRYCFENDTPAELREFVMRYAVCHIEDLWKRKEVIELARTHADFSSAIVEAMLYSLNW